MKTVKMLFIGLALFVMSFSFTFASDHTGSWRCVEYLRAGQKITPMQEQGKLELNADGSYLQTISTGIEEKGTYRIEETSIKLMQRDKAKMQGEIQGNTIILEFTPTQTKIVYQKDE
ncbi:MAG: hypothetical protein PHV55_07460 [Candidatus Omnitrophica bacterium]|nr:hypothetical protein [Candidatus Omnitrophota bacterium]